MPRTALLVWIMLAAVAVGQSRPAESAPASRAANPVARLRRPIAMMNVGSYALELQEDGAVVFEGEPSGELHSICLPGRHRGRVSIDEVEKTRRAFLDAGYLSFQDEYVDKKWFDAGAAGTAFWHEGRKKSVWRDNGDPSAPAVLRVLENRLDSLANPRWKGLGVSWLSVHQSSDGSWNAALLGEQCDPIDLPTCAEQVAGAWPAVSTTALALLPLSGAGRGWQSTNKSKNKSAQAARRGRECLIRAQSDDGTFGIAERGLGALTQAWALAALVSVRADTTRELVERTAAADKAKFALLRLQALDGSLPAPDGVEDGALVATAWAALALDCAKGAHVPIDNHRLAMAATFLEEQAELLAVALPKPADNRRGSRAWKAAAFAVAAAAWSGRDVRAGALTPLGELVANPALMPSAADHDPDPTALFFGLRALEALDDRKGVSALWRVAKDTSAREGCRAGSWNPRGGWERGGGRIYTTALMLLCELAFVRTPGIPGAR